MNLLLRKFRRALEIWKHRGYEGISQHSKLKFYFYKQRKLYQQWIQKNDLLNDATRRKILQKIETFADKPLISVVMPVYNVDEKWLRLCIESVKNQLYSNWEFCIADDASPAKHVRKVLDEYAAQDARFKIVFRETNGHISAASNSALKLAEGQFTVLLDHDDVLHETALFYVVKEINEHPEVEMIYSDEDLIDENERRYEPKFKPDWSPDFFYSLNLITHLSAYKTSLLQKIGGFRLNTEGSQDYDLALRVIENISAENIRHIPRVLYHWRAIRGSVAYNLEEKPYAHDRAKQAIKEHFERQKISAKVTDGYSCLHRVVYDFPRNLSVSIILMTPEIEIVKEILADTAEENAEIIVVGKKEFKNISQVKFVEKKVSVAHSLNEAAKLSTGDILIFFDVGVKPLSSEWFKELVSQSSRKEIGVAGGKVLNADSTIRTAGVILGTPGIVGAAHYGYPAEGPGNFLRIVLINNYSALAGVCAVRREVFGAGFDAKNFPNGLYEIDFCLRLLHECGLRNVFTPYAEFVQTVESPTEKVLRENVTEVTRFKEKWNSVLENDPYYNPNFSLSDKTFSITLNPRLSKL